MSRLEEIKARHETDNSTRYQYYLDCGELIDMLEVELSAASIREGRLQANCRLLREALECQGRELGICCQCREAIEAALKGDDS